MPERIRVLIMGAGGRDFHVFNTCYRNDPTREVVAWRSLLDEQLPQPATLSQDTQRGARPD